MVDREQFKSLVESGMRGSDIARAVGVTRQRVSQLARQMGLKIRLPTERQWREEQKAKRDEARRPNPAVDAAHISHAMCGKASELFVAADLTARGWNVFLPVYSNRDVDLVARKGGVIMAVEVRTSKIAPKEGAKQHIPRKTSFSGTHYAVVRKGAPVFYEPPLE